MGSEVKFRYGDNIKGLADSKKEQGTFYYDKSNQRLYLYTPSGASDSATLIPIGQSIIKVSSTSALNTYDDNAFYLDDNGNLYYYNSTINVMPQQIARLSDIETASSSTSESIVNINTQLNIIQSNIANIEKEIGDPKVTGGTDATGLYVYLDNLEANKVDNTVFESYKTAQANEFETYKNEAENKFLSADEELFLTDGVFFESYEYALKNSKYVQWSTELNLPESDKKTGPCIVLTIKNSTTPNPTENTIIIPAGELVDVYTGKDTSTIETVVDGLEISANVKTANLINSTNTDTVTLSVNKDNQIETGFNTSNIIVTAKDSDTVNLSVIGNQIAAAVNTSNIIDEDTLKVNDKQLIYVDANSLIASKPGDKVYLQYDEEKNGLTAMFDDTVLTVISGAASALETLETHTKDIATNKAEFNTYKEERATEFSAYQEVVGAYSYKDNEAESSGYFEQVQSHIDATAAVLTAEETARKEADTTLQGNIDSVSSALDTERSRAQSEEANLQADINAIYKINDNNIAEGILAQEITRSTTVDATLTENLNTEIQNRENGDATLQREIETLIDDVAEDFNTVNARIDAIYLKDGDAAATGLLADEITRSIQADEELDAAIQQVQTNLDTKESDLESLINSKDSQINAKIDSLYKEETITAEDGTTSISITGTIHTAISDIGTYEYQEKTGNTNAGANVVEDTYFAEVKKHIEGEAAEIRAEFAAVDNVLSNRLDTTNNNITSEIKRVEDLVAAETKSREDNDNVLIARLDNLYVAKTDTTAASGLVENNRLAIETINSTTIPQAEEKISENKTNITNLKTAYDAAIVVKDNALSGGQVKSYIDSQDKKLSEEIQNIVSNNAAEIYQTKEDANARFTSTTVGETTTYSGAIVDAYKAADEILDNKFDNYYTKNEAEEKFLSADEDLFLVSGAVKTGSLSNGKWQDDENGDTYIYLELKNNNDGNTDVNELYIAANELVDTYEADNAKDTPVEITVSDYKISADLSTTTKANIKLGTDAHSAVTNSATGLTAAHAAIGDINTSLTSNIGTYSYSASAVSATGNYFGAVKSHIEAIKSYSDNEDAELKKLIDTNSGNIKINTDRLAAIGKFTSATETGYSGELKALYNALNSKLTGDIGTVVNTLETGAVANNATNINSINTKLSAYGINNKSNNVYSLGDGVLKTYIDGKYNTNSTAIGANTTLINNSITTMNTKLAAYGINNANSDNNYTLGAGAIKNYTDNLVANYLPLTGGQLSGDLNILNDGVLVNTLTIGSPKGSGASGSLDMVGNTPSINLMSYGDEGNWDIPAYSFSIKPGRYAWSTMGIGFNVSSITTETNVATAKQSEIFKIYTNQDQSKGYMNLNQSCLMQGGSPDGGNPYPESDDEWYAHIIKPISTTQTSDIVYSVDWEGNVIAAGNVTANKVYGSVWNDYAEYRQTHHKVRPGQCVYEKGDGSLAISYERMMPGANIVSDTFGFAIGETDECKTPLAVSGRVLAYPYESKETYNPGDAVCSGPNGTISKMTRAEIRDYPERIVGTVSEIPTYEVWGSGNIKVNGRIWIKVR